MVVTSPTRAEPLKLKSQVMECLRLRVQDIDFARREIMVRQGKGGKDRRKMLRSMETPARYHLDKNVTALHPPTAWRLDGEVLPYATSLTCSSPSEATSKVIRLSSRSTGSNLPNPRS